MHKSRLGKRYTNARADLLCSLFDDQVRLKAITPAHCSSASHCSPPPPPPPRLSPPTSHSDCLQAMFVVRARESEGISARVGSGWVGGGSWGRLAGSLSRITLVGKDLWVYLFIVHTTAFSLTLFLCLPLLLLELSSTSPSSPYAKGLLTSSAAL